MKKRNCRMSLEEKKIHEEAIKLRKMTDRQLVEVHQGTYQNGFNEGLAYQRANTLHLISKVKGIGATTLEKIKEALACEGEVG